MINELKKILLFILVYVAVQAFVSSPEFNRFTVGFCLVMIPVIWINKIR